MKVVLSAPWVAMPFVFAYLDAFGFFRADVLNAALDGEVAGAGLAVDQVFPMATLIYVLLPSLLSAESDQRCQAHRRRVGTPRRAPSLGRLSTRWEGC